MTTFAIIYQNARRIAFAMGVFALSLVLVTGCSSPSSNKSGRKSIGLTITHKGSVVLDGSTVSLNRLPQALKSRGATSRTAIKVVVPENVSSEMVKDISETLVSGGYPRIIFSKPRKAIADKKEIR